LLLLQQLLLLPTQLLVLPPPRGLCLLFLLLPLLEPCSCWSRLILRPQRTEIPPLLCSCP
jgi:hypothetical protein